MRLARHIALRALPSRAASTKAPQTFARRIPAGDSRPRLVCETCDFIRYENPLIVAGCVAQDATGRILLARRAIEPRRGYWTLPAGYMETREAADAGAAREVVEETGLHAQVTGLLGVYSVPHVSQVHLWYRASLLDRPELAAADGVIPPSLFAAEGESLEVRLFAPRDIPWESLSFSSVRYALDFYLQPGNGAGASTVDTRTLS